MHERIEVHKDGSQTFHGRILSLEYERDSVWLSHSYGDVKIPSESMEGCSVGDRIEVRDYRGWVVSIHVGGRLVYSRSVSRRPGIEDYRMALRKLAEEVNPRDPNSVMERVLDEVMVRGV